MSDPLERIESLNHAPALAVGTRLGVYQIIAPIGAGGMGEVYRAHDSKLGRDVAIKVLPQSFAAEPDRLVRFEREARLLAALNHPNIAQIHGLEESDGVLGLVMELVEGETLADRIARNPMPLTEALPIARHIAEALAAAHEQGIIHRDLKPANVKVRPDGVVKVLDFGLAKWTEPASAADAMNSPTLSARSTQQGLILGTAAYMSPEQASGQRVDRRTDLWSFGVVLFEMLTGRRVFDGESVSHVIAAVLKTEPEWETLPANTPLPIRRLLRRCLEKDCRRRLESAADARLEIDDALQAPARETALPPIQAAGRSTRLWQALTALMALIAVSIAGWVFWRPTSERASRFEASFPEGATPGDYVSVSPDGRKLVFAAAAGTGGLWMRDFGSLDWRHLPGTESAASPFWSPDSRYLAFAVRNQLKKVDTTGGPPQTLCTVPARAQGSGSWSRNGVIIFGSWGGGSGGPVWRVSQAGGDAVAVTEVDTSKGELYHTWPVFLEDGKHFLYFRSGPREVAGIYVGSLDAKPGDQSRERILETELTAAYANGYLFFMRAATMMAQPFDLRQLKLKDAPVPVADAVRTTWHGTEVFSVSSGGAIAYRTFTAFDGFQLTWIDRQGKIVNTVGPPSSHSGVGLALSPDGKRAVMRDSFMYSQGDLWTVDLSNGQQTRFTFGRANYSPGVWSPDGNLIAYAGGNLGDTLYEKDSSGTGEARELLKEPGTRHYVTSWSRDGRFLLYHTENTPKTGYDVWVLPLVGERKPVLLLGDTFNEWAARFSPDVRWIVYASTESGAEIFVRPLRISASGTPALGEGKWQVSRDGGNWPVWRSDKEILFTNDQTETGIVATSVNTPGTAFQSGIPQQLFRGQTAVAWDVSPDGQRFLVSVPLVQRTGQAPIGVVLNWPALLKK
jgi:Tol biopolymer transport system component